MNEVNAFMFCSDTEINALYLGEGKPGQKTYFL